jgi:hypothetical protein
VAASWSQGGSSLYRRYRAAKPLRVVIEPGFAIAVMSNDAWLFVRPGLRYIWQRLPSGAGIGAGIGSTFSWAQYRGGAASLSPELLLQSGSPHLLIAIRFEHPVAGREPAALVASIGATVW